MTTPALPGITGPPTVSISLVTWNGMHWLGRCLDSVRAQSLAQHELLIFDNASGDGSSEWLGERAAGDARTRLTRSPENLGYAHGHNRNIEQARGEFILLLNQDVELEREFLASMLAVLRARPAIGSVQGRLRRLGAQGEHTMILDTTGLEMRRDHRASIRDHRRRDDDVAATVAGPVWGVDGPAAMFRSSALLHARLPRRGGGTEVLDEDFYMQKEDVDLAWRLRRLDWEAWYEPTALAWHARTGVGSATSSMSQVARANMANDVRERSRSWRNQRLMQVKNEQASDFLRDLPWIVWRELLELGFITLRDRRRLRAVPDLVRALPWAMRKRRALATLPPRRPDPPRTGPC